MLHRAWPLALALVAAGPPPGVQQLIVPSEADGRPLHGQIDLPARKPLAVVVLFQGSGNHRRDYEYSVPGSRQSSYLFRELASRLNAAGLAAVRFDERGCAPDPTGGRSECTDRAAISTVNMDTLQGDARAVYRRAAAAPGGRCLIAFGHSEGFYHVARLVEDGARPAGIIGVGAPMRSLKDIVRWQQVDRAPESIAASDLDRDGRVTEQEMRANLANTPLGRRKYEDLQWPAGFGWPKAGMTPADIAALRVRLAQQHVATSADILAKPPSDVYTIPLGNGISRMAAYGWQQAFLREGPTVASYLSRYRGPIHLFYGARDSQLDTQRELAANGCWGNRGSRSALRRDWGMDLESIRRTNRCARISSRRLWMRPCGSRRTAGARPKGW